MKLKKVRQKTKDTELDDTIEELGYTKIGKDRGKAYMILVDVADLGYFDNDEELPKDENDKGFKGFNIKVVDKDSK